MGITCSTVLILSAPIGFVTSMLLGKGRAACGLSAASSVAKS